MEPTAPVAAPITSVWPATRPSMSTPTQAVSPGIPSAPSAWPSAIPSGRGAASFARTTAVSAQPVWARTRVPSAMPDRLSSTTPTPWAGIGPSTSAGAA